MFTKPRDREVVCHASAWDIDFVDDLRVKVCLDPTAEDFSTIHHELGHNFYQRAYDKQPPLFRNSANDGFHEAIGDTIALSVTPEYLKQIGFLDSVPPPSADIGLLLNRALEKVAFLPFGLMIDKWRWGVFSGKIPPAEYNKAWWDLRREYQGVAPPVARTEADFDPGAKYHIPANVPYARYFLSFVLQFQFHRALCQAAGYTGSSESLLDLRQQSRRRKTRQDARNGPEPPVARSPRSDDRRKRHRRHRHPRLFRAAQAVARRAEQRPQRRLEIAALADPSCFLRVSGGASSLT